MTDRQLKYLITLAEEGNMTTAARKLYISQPSLSSLLSHVEEQLGVQLFDRNTNPMRPTYAGEQYLSAAKRILGIQRELDIHMNEIRHEKGGKLIIGCGSRLLPVLFPRILPSFMKENPGIQIKLVEGNLKYLTEMLDTGNLDLIFTNHSIDSLELGSVTLYREQAILYTPRGYLEKEQTKERTPLKNEKMRNCPFALLNTSAFRETTDRILRENNFFPDVILESSSWEVCMAMVEAGLACTILPNYQITAANLYSGTDSYVLPDSHFRNTVIYYRKNFYHHQIMEMFLTHCQQMAETQNREIE